MRCLQVSVRLILTLWLALAPVKAWAGSMMLLGAGMPASSGGGPTVTPILAMAGPLTGPSNSAANYIGLYSGSLTAAWSTSTTQRVIPIPIPGSISSLAVRYPSGAGAGTWAVALRKNSSTSANVTCSFTAASTCSGGTSESIAAGDLVGWVSTPTSTPTANTTVQVSALFTSTNNNETFIAAAGSTGAASTSVANYMGFGGYTSYQATEAIVSSVMPTAGTIDNLWCNSSSIAGASKGYYLTLFKNGVVTSLQCKISGASQTKNDSATSGTNTPVSVLQNDTISIEICPQFGAYSGSCVPDIAPNVALLQAAARFVPTVAGESVAFAQANSTQGGVPPTTITNYTNLSSGTSTNATETNELNYAPSGFSVSKLTVCQNPQPGSGVTRTYTVRNNTGAIDTALTTTIAAGTSAAGLCPGANNDNSNTASFSPLDLSTMKTTVSGTNTALTYFKVGIVLK